MKKTEALPSLTPLMDAESAPIRQSYAQRRLWFLNQMGPESGQHNIVFRLSLVGPALSQEKLSHALFELVQRHSVLRTCYRSKPEGVEQLVSREFNVDIHAIDYTIITSGSENEAIQSVMREQQNTPFDLLRGPVLRALLVALGNGRQELIFNIHHIAFDGRSLELFVTELSQLYVAPEALSPVSVQYRDFAAWEPAYITRAFIEEELVFWRDYLRDVPTLMEFEGRPRQEGPLNAARHHFLVEPSLADRIKAAANAQGHSLFTALVGLFNLWMHYLCGKPGFLIGTDVHGRDHPALADIMGFFVNQLTIKCDLSGDPCLAEFLHRSHELTAAALAHRRLPFDVLVSALSPQRQSDRTPLFQVKINYQRYRFPIDRIGEARITQTQILQDMAGFDLVLDLTHGPTGIESCLEYDLRRFSKDDIERFSSLWLTLLAESEYLLEQPISHLCQRMQQWENTHLHDQQQAQTHRNRTRLMSAARKARLV